MKKIKEYNLKRYYKEDLLLDKDQLEIEKIRGFIDNGIEIDYSNLTLEKKFYVGQIIFY